MEMVAPIYKKSWYNGVIREEDHSSSYGSKQAQLDQIMKKLFTLSDQVTLYLLNSIFDESFAIEDVSIRQTNGEFINDEYDRIVGDLFFVVENKGHSINYHIEFQTMNDASMVVRMFRYGFEKAVELAKLGRNHVITLPKQLVIFLEKNGAVDDFLSFTLRLPDGTEMDYNVPVMKYWTYTEEELAKRKMHALLPLQVFQYRKAMRAIERSNRSPKEREKFIRYEFVKMEQTIGRIIDVLKEVDDNSVITLHELDGILSAIQNLSSYLYSHYGEYNSHEREVQDMIDTFIDPQIWEDGKKKGRQEGLKEGLKEGRQEGKLEVARRLLHKGLKAHEVAEITDLPVEEIERL